MNLTQLIQDIKDKGLMSVAPINLKGKAKPTFGFFAIMNDTDLEETDPDWWQLHLWIRRN